MPRRTKIVSTLGPATDREGVLSGLVQAGIDVARLNFSHGSAADHEKRANAVREAAEACGRDVAILADMQGPKIRTGAFADGPVTLTEGSAFTLDVSLPDDAGTADTVGVTYEQLPGDVTPGDILLLDDGQLSLRVESVDGPRVHCSVAVGGVLSDHKGINRLGGGLTAQALTDKDREDIKTAARLGVDYVAISFPRDAEDIEQARQLVRAAGSEAGIVAKIERSEAVDNIEAILQATDVVMVARGDLAVEIGYAELPGVQKRIVELARKHDRIVITATQMMESMIENPVPTRAEVLDVANAVLDGTDAVMLSAETAAGRYPVKTVEAMARVCEGAERQDGAEGTAVERFNRPFTRVDEAIAMAAAFTANHLGAKAIITLTESGSTPLWISRIRSNIPIYALTRFDSTRRRVTLFRGVHPLAFDILHANPDHVLQAAAARLAEHGAVHDGDLVLFTKGDFTGVAGGTNSLKVLRIGDPSFSG